jgi:hypothetical protein
MSPVSHLLAVAGLCGLVVACGGKVAPGPGTETVHADAGLVADSSTGGGQDASPDESCAALADCCGEFEGSAADTCNAVANTRDEDGCANQVTTYQSMGECVGQ